MLDRQSGWIYFRYTLFCGHLVHKYVTLYSLLVLAGCEFQHVTIYQFFKVQMDFCKAIKSSAIFGSAGSGERERGLCSPGDYLNPRQFVGKSGVNPTLEGG